MSFLNPFFLAFLGAAALPVLYHLVRKMKAKKVVFSSLMFLKATPKELVRRRKLRDLVLMAVRMAIFALLALVFARPFLPPEALSFLSTAEDHSTVLLLDESFSMGYGDRFERAKAEVRRRLDAAGADDEFAVIAFSDQVRQLTPLADDPALARTVLDALAAPGFRPTDFHPPLRRAEELLADARHEARTIVLVSDFQRGGWGGAFENWTLAPGITFVPVSVAEASAAGNAALDAVTLTPQRAGERTAVRFDARVQAHGPLAETRRALRLTLDGAEADRTTLAARATNRATFQQADLRTGLHLGTLTLDPDALPLDDTYYFALPLEDRPSVLLVDEGSRGTRRDAFFLENAFDLGETARYRVRVGGRGLLSAAELRNHRVVFLTNLPALSAAQVGTLRQYVEDGGSVVFSFGPQASLPALSAALSALGLGTTDGVVQARAVQNYDAIIGEVAARHPIFIPFAGTPALFRPTFRRYARLVPDSAAVVLGRFDAGDPFLVERRLGQGTVLAYAATFNTAWTDFPVQEAYVPFVYQLARYATRAAEARRQFVVGEAVPLDGRPGEAWEVRTPDDRLLRVTVAEDGRGFFRATDQPGLYVAAKGRTPFHFAVNVDPRESDLTARDAEEAYAAVVPPAETPRDPVAAAALALEEAEQRQNLWRVLLLIVLALFVFETVYANRRTGTAGGTTKAHRKA